MYSRSLIEKGVYLAKTKRHNRLRDNKISLFDETYSAIAFLIGI